MTSIGEIISKYRKAAGLSQPDLAAKLNENGLDIKYKAVSSWENNRTEPSVTAFMLLTKILGITNVYEDYFGENPDNPMNGLNEEGIAKAMDYISLLLDSGKYNKPAAKIIEFRRYIDVYENRASAGTGNTLTDGPKTTFTITNPTLVPENATFGVRIMGNSMEPEYYDGEIAWVHQTDVLENGDIGIFSLNDEAYIKKLGDDSEGLRLISLNKEYNPIYIKENDDLHVFGKVVGKCSSENLSELI